MNPKEYPLACAKAISELDRFIRTIIKENSDIIDYIDEDPESLIELYDINYPQFSFKIYKKVEFANDITPQLLVEVEPYSSALVHGFQVYLDIDNMEINGRIEEWIAMIRDYNSIPTNSIVDIERFYENEFKEEFEIAEDDADLNPLSSLKQEQLYCFLQKLIENAENIKQKYDVEEVIEQASELKQELAISTKKKVVSKLSKLFATIKKSGVEVAKELFKEGLKELVKYALTEGYKHLT